MLRFRRISYKSLQQFSYALPTTVQRIFPTKSDTHILTLIPIPITKKQTREYRDTKININLKFKNPYSLLLNKYKTHIVSHNRSK